MYDYEEKFWKTINRFVDKNYELSGTNVVSKVTGEVLVTFKHTRDYGYTVEYTVLDNGLTNIIIRSFIYRGNR